VNKEVIIKPVNAAFIKIVCHESIAYELNNHFAFKIHNASFNPKVKSKRWDGIIRLFHLGTRMIYKGLLNDVKKFCEDRNYIFINELEDNIKKVTFDEIQQFITDLDIQIPEKGEAYEYQVQAVVDAINEKRTLTLSPTSSGKSVIIYALARYLNTKTIIVVDRKAYVEQIYDNFKEYGYDVEKFCHRIYSGKEKVTDKQIIITTWQSIINNDPEWFEQFDAMIGDEIHKFTAKSLKYIMENLVNCEYRNGYTGTIDDKIINTLTLKGMFGEIHETVSTQELIEDGRVAKPYIKIIKLKYPDDVRQKVMKSIANRNKEKEKAIDKELEYLLTSDLRNQYIINLALSLKGNTIILFQYREHGKAIYDELLSRENKPENIYYVDGTVNVLKRQEIQKLIDSHETSITVASIGTFAENINIRNLNNAILTMPLQDKIRLLQALGRILRKTSIKDSAWFFDIADIFTIKSATNPSVKRLLERLKIYSKQGHTYNIYDIELGV